MTDSLIKRAHRSHTLLINRLRDIGQDEIALQCRFSESALSVFKKEYLERYAMVISACGLKLVAEAAAEQALTPAQAHALLTLTIPTMQRMKAELEPETDAREGPASGFGGLGS